MQIVDDAPAHPSAQHAGPRPLESAADLPGAPRPCERTLALRDARLVGASEERVTLLVREGRIDAIVDARQAVEAERSLDLEGRWVMPGLIDAHAHLSSFELPTPRRGDRVVCEAEVRTYAQACAARDTLAAGVTTLRDVGGYGRELFALREALALGLAAAPRLLLCGQIISASSRGGRRFEGMYSEADGPDELRKATREQFRLGADFIKVMSTGALTVREPIDPAQLTHDEIGAVVSEARRLGVRVASHAEGLDGIRLSIEAGVDTIEHGEQLFRAPELLEAMAERGIVLVPTLSVFEAVAEDERRRFPPRLVEQAKQLRENAYATVAAAKQSGVPIAMGFDSHPHGRNALEAIRLAEAGLTNAEALDAATAVAADACGLGDVGRLEAGALADLLVLDADPLERLEAIAEPSSIWLVVQAGEAVGGTATAGTALS